LIFFFHDGGEVGVLALLPKEHRAHRQLGRVDGPSQHFRELLLADETVAVHVVKSKQELEFLFLLPGDPLRLCQSEIILPECFEPFERKGLRVI